MWINAQYASGPFHIDPDYSKEKVVGLTRDVAETYVPVKITVAYPGQAPVPKPSLMILTLDQDTGGMANGDRHRAAGLASATRKQIVPNANRPETCASDLSAP